MTPDSATTATGDIIITGGGFATWSPDWFWDSPPPQYFSFGRVFNDYKSAHHYGCKMASIYETLSLKDLWKNTYEFILEKFIWRPPN